MTNEDEFLSKVHEQQCFVPPGILLNVYNESDNKRYEVYKVVWLINNSIVLNLIRLTCHLLVSNSTTKSYRHL